MQGRSATCLERFARLHQIENKLIMIKSYFTILLIYRRVFKSRKYKMSVNQSNEAVINLFSRYCLSERGTYRKAVNSCVSFVTLLKIACFSPAVRYNVFVCVQVDALQGHRVIDVACGSGDAQTLCLTDDDMVWSWGDGDYGKLGRGGSDGCKVPMKVRPMLYLL